MEQKDFYQLLCMEGSFYRLIQEMSKNIVIVYPNYEKEGDVEERLELNLEEFFNGVDDEDE